MVHRYLHSIIIAPDAFTKPSGGHPGPDGFFSQFTESTPRSRKTLASLSRLLYFVVGNKGFVGRAGVPQMDQAAALNPLIKAWHARFREYLLSVIGDAARKEDPMAMNAVRKNVDNWIKRLPTAHTAKEDGREISLTTEVRTHLRL